MTKETLDRIQASNHKLACVRASDKHDENWAKKQKVQYIGMIAFAGDYLDNSYLVFEIPEEMKEEEFSKITLVDKSFLFDYHGTYTWEQWTKRYDSRQ